MYIHQMELRGDQTCEQLFSQYIVDTQTNGSLSPKCEILKFFSMYDILLGHENKYRLVRTKVFNEKKKFRIVLRHCKGVNFDWMIWGITLFTC